MEPSLMHDTILGILHAVTCLHELNKSSGYNPTNPSLDAIVCFPMPGFPDETHPPYKAFRGARAGASDASSLSGNLSKAGAGEEGWRRSEERLANGPSIVPRTNVEDWLEAAKPAPPGWCRSGDPG
ncbi:UNVERIFIED_CONTAM: hypothetical protein K2H54_000717 [Gekko kuhli]